MQRVFVQQFAVCTDRRRPYRYKNRRTASCFQASWLRIETIISVCEFHEAELFHLSHAVSHTLEYKPKSS